MATKQSDAVARNAALLVSIFGATQAWEEARIRAEAAKAYACPLSAELWQKVADAIGKGAPADCRIQSNVALAMLVCVLRACPD